MSQPLHPALHAAICTFAATEWGSKNVANDAQGALTVLTETWDIDNTLHQRSYKWSEVFAVLASTRNSWWLLPLTNKLCTLSGSQIYRPYARRARILKKLLLGFIRIAPLVWARQRVIIVSARPILLQQLVTEVTGEREPVFSLLLGTPGVHRKLTAQVMRPSGEILGYVKLPLTEAAIGRVANEAAILRKLAAFPELRPHIPRVMYSGEWQGGQILLQSAGPPSTGPIRFGLPHQRFLDALRSVEHRDIAGSMLVSAMRARWRAIEAALDLKLRTLGTRALDIAERDLAHCILACGIGHGDFTPWNTRLTDNGTLFVFDWESATCDTPRSWDIFHFHGQTATLLIKKKHGSLFPSCNSVLEKASLFLYLIDRVCRSYELGSQTTAGISHLKGVLQQELA